MNSTVISINCIGYTESLRYYLSSDFKSSCRYRYRSDTMSGNGKLDVIVTNVKKFCKMLIDWVAQNRIEIDLERTHDGETRTLHLKCPSDHISRIALEQVLSEFIMDKDADYNE